MLLILRVSPTGGHDHAVIVVDKAVIDQEGLQLTEEEPALLGDAGGWIRDERSNAS